jgi:AcrR family transcriptional regulator
VPRVLSADDVSSFRDRLCQAAERLFAEHGPDAVTMRQLAADLGCSPMTPYRYFKDKEEILAAVRSAAFDRFADALEQAFSAAAVSDPMARSEAVGRAYVRFALAEPHAYRLMFDLMQPGEEAYPELVRATDRARATMTNHLKGLMPPEQFAVRGGLIGHVFWAAVHGVLMLHLAGKLGPEVEVGALMESMMKTVAAGISSKITSIGVS